MGVDEAGQDQPAAVVDARASSHPGRAACTPTMRPSSTSSQWSGRQRTRRRCRLAPGRLGREVEQVAAEGDRRDGAPHRAGQRLRMPGGPVVAHRARRLPASGGARRRGSVVPELVVGQRRERHRAAHDAHRQGVDIARQNSRPVVSTSRLWPPSAGSGRSARCAPRCRACTARRGARRSRPARRSAAASAPRVRWRGSTLGRPG